MVLRVVKGHTNHMNTVDAMDDGIGDTVDMGAEDGAGDTEDVGVEYRADDTVNIGVKGGFSETNMFEAGSHATDTFDTVDDGFGEMEDSAFDDESGRDSEMSQLPPNACEFQTGDEWEKQSNEEVDEELEKECGWDTALTWPSIEKVETPTQAP